MDTAKLKKLYYHVRHQYVTMNNIVILVALLMAAGWAWGSISMMQRNYALQRSVDAQKREAELLELQVATMQYEQNYYKSDEYKDLAAREHLGLASPGEKVLFLPPNSDAAKNADKTVAKQAVADPPSNLDQWLSFLLGSNASNTGA